MEGLIDATFIKIDQVVWVQGSQFVSELCAGEFISLDVQERFFFG